MALHLAVQFAKNCRCRYVRGRGSPVCGNMCFAKSLHLFIPPPDAGRQTPRATKHSLKKGMVTGSCFNFGSSCPLCLYQVSFVFFTITLHSNCFHVPLLFFPNSNTFLNCRCCERSILPHTPHDQQCHAWHSAVRVPNKWGMSNMPQRIQLRCHVLKMRKVTSRVIRRDPAKPVSQTSRGNTYKDLPTCEQSETQAMKSTTRIATNAAHATAFVGANHIGGAVRI